MFTSKYLRSKAFEIIDDSRYCSNPRNIFKHLQHMKEIQEQSEQLLKMASILDNLEKEVELLEKEVQKLNEELNILRRVA